MVDFDSFECFDNQKIIIDNFIEPHLLLVFLLDTSAKMCGEALYNINEALNAFIKSNTLDEETKRRVDISIIEFNSNARVVQDFVPFSQMSPITLSASCCVVVGDSINFAIDRVKQRTRFYAEIGTPYYKPWIFMITDSNPTDDISVAKKRISQEEKKKRIRFLSVGLPYCMESSLLSISDLCIKIDDFKDFEAFFGWVEKLILYHYCARPELSPDYPDYPDFPQSIRVIKR